MQTAEEAQGLRARIAELEFEICEWQTKQASIQEKIDALSTSLTVCSQALCRATSARAVAKNAWLLIANICDVFACRLKLSVHCAGVLIAPPKVLSCEATAAPSRQYSSTTNVPNSNATGQCSAEQICKERRSRLEEQLSAADKREYQLQLNLTDAEQKLYMSQLEQQSAQKALTATQTTVDNLKEHLRDARSQISRTLSDTGRVQDALVASTSLSASLSHDLAALKVRSSPRRSGCGLLMLCTICACAACTRCTGLQNESTVL